VDVSGGVDPSVIAIDPKVIELRDIDVQESQEDRIVNVRSQVDDVDGQTMASVGEVGGEEEE